MAKKYVKKYKNGKKKGFCVFWIRNTVIDSVIMVLCIFLEYEGVPYGESRQHQRMLLEHIVMVENQQAQMKQHVCVLETYFGYTSLDRLKRLPIASLLRNEDVIAIMPTGLVSLMFSDTCTLQIGALLSYFHHLFL